MTASRHDPPALPNHVRTRILVATLIAALPSCRAGLPPEPPGADPADPNAAAPAFQVQANPYETSAFAGPAGMGRGGEAAGAGHAGHEHMGHGAKSSGQEHSGHMGHGDGAAESPAPTTPAKPEHAGHGAMSAPERESAPVNPPKQEESRR